MFFGGRTVGGSKTLNATVGTVLAGRYRVQRTLGTGGMAVVYEAEDAILRRHVALKTLHRRFAEESSFRVRFKQEARVMASLDHENIIKVYDISQAGEVPFIVAEYIDGQDVGSILKAAPGGRLSEKYTRELAAQLLRAIAYAHRCGVIHRDVKPSNILITEEGTVKVADFGIARLIEEEDAGEPGEIIGSARYMSPEQLRGEKTTPRSDLYSVGVLLYHCLTGRPPFSGNARSVARQQIHKEPVSPRKLNRAISPHMQAVILKALSKDPEDRYPSASEMLDDLEWEDRTSTFDPVEATGGPRKRRTRKRRNNRKALLLASAVLALLLLGGGTAAGLRYVGLENLPLPWRTEALVSPKPEVESPPKKALDTLRKSEEPTTESTESTESPQVDSDLPEEDVDVEDTQAVETVSVPNVDTLFDYFAVQTLQNSGFQPEVVYRYREGYAPKGVAWGTDPVAGTMAPAGSTITVYVTPKDQPQTVQPQPPPAPVAPAPVVPVLVAPAPVAPAPQPQVQASPAPVPVATAPQPQVQAVQAPAPVPQAPAPVVR